MCAQRRSRPACASIRSDQNGCHVCPATIQTSLGIDQVRSKWLLCVPREDPDQPGHRSGQIKMAAMCAQRRSRSAFASIRSDQNGCHVCPETIRPALASIRSDQSGAAVCTQCGSWFLHAGQRRLWSDWANLLSLSLTGLLSFITNCIH